VNFLIVLTFVGSAAIIKNTKKAGKMPNLRDDHLPPIGHLTPVYPIRKITVLFAVNISECTIPMTKITALQEIKNLFFFRKGTKIC
jgi:hypothetical protein